MIKFGKIERKFEVIEDNGGGLTLAVFGDNDEVIYFHSGFEYNPGTLMECLKSLKDGDDPIKHWDGNEEEPQKAYDNLTSFEYGWEIVADNDGIYPEKMGYAACKEFGVENE